MPRRLPAFLALLWLACLALAGGSAAQVTVSVPVLAQRVTDFTGTLTAAQAAALETELAAFEARKGSQVAVLVVATTQPEPIEQYAMRVVEVWKLGRQGVDDGVLLLVAKDDRALRIEVGYGLEGALNDATAKRIIEEHITPLFKQGDFHAGIHAGLTRIMQVVDGEPLPAPAAPPADPVAEAIALVVVGLFVLIFAAIGGFILSLFIPHRIAAGLVGAGAGWLGWGLLGQVVGGLVIGLAVFAIVYRLGGRARGGRGGGTGGSSGWSSSSGDGGSSGSGSSGGGFSGGGGFGGGGASGRW